MKRVTAIHHPHDLFHTRSFISKTLLLLYSTISVCEKATFPPPFLYKVSTQKFYNEENLQNFCVLKSLKISYGKKNFQQQGLTKFNIWRIKALMKAGQRPEWG